MYSGYGGQSGTASNKTSSNILFYSQKKYIFQPDQIGLILKTKDAQQSHRNSTRTEYIYIYISLVISMKKRWILIHDIII